MRSSCTRSQSRRDSDLRHELSHVRVTYDMTCHDIVVTKEVTSHD